MKQFTEINSIMFCAPTMFESKGNNKDLLVFIVHITNFSFTVVTTFIADRVGRRTLLIIGCIGCGLGLLLATLGYSDGVSVTIECNNIIFNVGVYLFIASFATSHGPIDWVYAAEILPCHWMGYNSASSWVFTSAISLSTSWILSTIGRWTFFIFYLCMAISGIFCVLYIRETKGMTKMEILSMFMDRTDAEIIVSKTKIKNKSTTQIREV